MKSASAMVSNFHGSSPMSSLDLFPKVFHNLTLNIVYPFNSFTLIFGLEAELPLLVTFDADVESASVIGLLDDEDMEESKVDDTRGVFALFGFVVQ